MSGDVPKKPGLRYSDSPHAPDWARDPSLRSGNQITSFGQPIPQAGEESVAKAQELYYSDSPHAPDWARHPSDHKPKLPHQPDEPFRPSVEWFEDLLWKEASDDVRVYCIMDGYWAKGLYGRLLASPDISWAHMFQGDVALNNIQDAPFIIALKRGHKLLRWLIEEGWGDGWGIYFTASTKAALDRYGKTTRLPPDMTPSNEEKLKLCNLVEGMEDPLWLMRRHFRHFSDVEFEDDARVVDFRYYDPATLRTYLPSCNDNELRRFCGPVIEFYTESFRREENLKQPWILFKYAARPELSRDLFEGTHINLHTGKQMNIERLPSSTGKAHRELGWHAMIRLGQRKAFSSQEEKSFTMDACVKMKKILPFLKKKPDIPDMFVWISRQISAGRNCYLQSEKELLAFITCAFILGEGFEHNSLPAIALFEAQRKGQRVDIAANLANLAKKSICPESLK